MKVMKIPRFVPEGKVNYNKVLLNVETLNRELDKMIEEQRTFIYKYRDVEERKNSPGGFHTTDINDVIGYIEGYDKEFITVKFIEDITIENPVAVITSFTFDDNIVNHEDYNEYSVKQVIIIEVVEETTLGMRRIKL